MSLARRDTKRGPPWLRSGLQSVQLIKGTQRPNRQKIEASQRERAGVVEVSDGNGGRIST